ncbi:MAG: hypothetical protein JSV53_00460 [candidate division WOR-3 bacterium]|nr:MAG: hypothetical protein JSV53_00460 [candidate division WOR-3 bacterium]
MHKITGYHKPSLILIVGILLLFTAQSKAQDTTAIDTAFCCFPPFTWKTPTPNIMIILDNSGSMADRAYTTTTIVQGTAADTIRYYGYFNPDSNYLWDVNRWRADPAGIMPGHIMNWAIMSRGDVAKKVLIGGRGPSTFVAMSNPNPVRLESEGRGSWTVYYRSNLGQDDNYSMITVTHAVDPMLSRVSVTRVGNGPLPTEPVHDVQVDVPRATWGGVLAQLADKDGDGFWDENAPRFGLAGFNYGPGGFWDGYDEGSGTFADNGGGLVGGSGYIGGFLYTDLYQDIRNVEFRTWTPVGECYWEMLRYFSQAAAFYSNNDYTVGPVTVRDPWYEKSIPGPSNWSKMTPCRKSFILLITDGQPRMDLHVPDNSTFDMPGATNLRSYATYAGSGIPNGPNLAAYPDNGSNYLIHLAYYGNINDLRPDSVPDVAEWRNRNLPDFQNVTLFGVAAFESNFTLEQACKFGGFVDNNNNKRPDLQIEWDNNFDNIPDNYFEAEDGYKFEEVLIKAVMEMMSRVASASPVAVVTTGSKTGGQAIQSQFYQVKFFPDGEMVDWLGTTHSLWLDPFGLLREDTHTDATLNLFDDYVVNMISHQTGVTIVRYRDLDGNGQNLDSVGMADIDDLVPVWDAGEWLLNVLPEERRIITFVDVNKNHSVEPGEIDSFTTANATTLRPYLGVSTDAQADTVIRYVRGQDFPDLRSRTVGTNTWKLGDVINSGPGLVGRPIERYDFIYGDASYAQYYNQYRGRRQVVYVGSNDGMLHCFNAGIVEAGDDATAPMSLDPAGYALGEELWAYIPYNLLPHLRWLKSLRYRHCHTYYVDLRAYVTDAQIFDSSNSKYPGGWGTLLIGGMRLGGFPITTQNDTCSSAYFAIDVTDPVNPEPLWEFTAPGLGLTACYSTAVKVDSTWYLVFGSGPQSCSGESAQNARIFIVDLLTGALLRTIVVPDAGSFITNIFACDWGIDYTVDRLYFGDAFFVGPPTRAWRGRLYRILTNDNPDPNTWTLSMVMDVQRPVTAEGSVSTDEYNHLWVYFGTGRLFSEFDIADTTTQQLYVGFRDDTVHTTDPFQLYNVTDVNIDTLGNVILGGGSVITFDSLKTLVNEELGWYRWLPAGERTLTATLVMGGAVLFTTFSPTEDICSYGGTAKLYALYYRTGTAYEEPFLGATGNINNISLDLGSGMPSEPALYVTADQTKVFIQVGGVIVSPETGIPGLPRGGVILWKGR